MKEARLLAAGLPQTARAGLCAGGAFAGHTLIAEVGRGAMGVVFTAQQHGSRRIVAMKVAHGSLAGSAEAMRRFRTEAEAVAALDHPGILPIYEVGECDGVAFHTMRFAEVGSLAERMEDFRSPRAAAALVAQVADAVQHAHERGILHRDLKPGNVLLAGVAEPLVSDFGLARWLARDTDATASLTVLGTPDYLAPEMLRGAREGSTTAADVFSLGAILHHLLAGRAPFAGESVAAVLHNVERCAPPPLREAPRDLAAVCARCLEREPSRRYASAGALAADLRAWLAGRPVTARPIGPAGRALRWMRRRPVRTALIAALLVSLAALGGHIVAARQRLLAAEQRRAEQAEGFAREQRRAALLARAQLRLQSTAPGRRTETLALLREAWSLGPSPEIRSVAIAALATLDAEPGVMPAGVALAVPDEAMPAPDVPLPAAIVQRAYDPATDRLALAAEDKLIYLIDPARRAIVRRLRGHAGVVTAMRFSPDGHLLATVSDDQTLRLWEVRGGGELLVCGAASETPRWSADGQWLALGPERALRLLAPTLAQRFIPEREESRIEELVTIDLSADGRWLATVGENGTRLWDARTRRAVALFPKDRAEWSAARFSPDSRRLWIGGWNSKLRVLDLIHDDEPRYAARFAGALYAQSADGAWLAAVSNAGGGFQCVSAAALHRAVWLRHAHPLSLAFSPDGTRAATSSFDTAGVRLWDFPSGKTERTLPVEPPAQLAFTADGARLATAVGAVVTLWDAATGERGRHVTATAIIEHLAFHPDGEWLAIETRDGLALHRAAPPHEVLARLDLAPAERTASFCFSRDGLRLAVQTATGGAIVWQLDALARELAALGMAW